LSNDINAVVVTYNNKELLEICLKTLCESLSMCREKSIITVVDNASHDGTEELVKGKFPQINYIRNQKNLGLAKALNIGINAYKKSKYTLLLNDDVELFPDTISSMIEILERFPSAAGVPAALVYPDGREQRIKLKIVGGHKVFPKKTKYTTFAGTTACLYYTEVFNIVGLFDEFYFFYNEDLDFSLRCKRLGLRFIAYIKPYFYATDYYFYRKNFGVLFSCVYRLMAGVHFYIWRRRFKKLSDTNNMKMLEQGRKKLFETVKKFKNKKSKYDKKVACQETVQKSNISKKTNTIELAKKLQEKVNKE